jgi:hypothetical protein
MITVNLKPGQKRKRGGNPFKGLLDNLGFLRDLSAKVKDPLLMGAIGAWVLVVAALGLIYLNQIRQLYVLEPRLEQARSEHRRFKAFIADKRRQEKIRDSLLAQITVIRSVDGERYIWPHLLDEITKALPAYTWRRLPLLVRRARRRIRRTPRRRLRSRSRSMGAPSTSRPTPGSSGSWRPRPGSWTCNLCRPRRLWRRSGPSRRSSFARRITGPIPPISAPRPSARR